MTPAQAHIEVLEALHENAEKHAKMSKGFFVIDDFDPKNLEPFIHLGIHGDTSNRRAVYNRLAYSDLANTMPLVDDRYSTLTTSPEQQRDSELALDNMATIMGRLGINVALLMKHGETRDIEFNLAHVSIGLSQKGVQHRTATILSKGIDMLRIDTSSFGLDKDAIRMFLKGVGVTLRADGTVPVRDFVGLASDLIYFVFPNSKSFIPIRKKHPRIISKFNSSTLGLKDKDLAITGTEIQGQAVPPLLVGLAGTGQTELDLDVQSYLQAQHLGIFETVPKILNLEDFERARVIGMLGEGLLHHTGGSVTFTSGMVLSEETNYYLNPRFVIANEEADLPNLSGSLAETLSALDPSTLFIEDRKRNLPTLSSGGSTESEE